MAKLMDIKGYWSMSYGPFFNESDMWEGKILLEEDGWFEGIVNDPDSSFVGDRLVFGIYYPTKVIELLKVSPASVSNPFIFRGKRDAKGYEGEFSVIKLFREHPYGACHIITQDVEYLKESNYSEVSERNVESEKEILRKKISDFKEKDEFEELYNNTLVMRKQIAEIILRNYNGKKFTAEETEQIMSDFQLMNEKVVAATIEEAKTLVKKREI